MKQTHFYPLHLFTAFLAACLLFGCARQSAPTGGPKDTTPPEVDSTASTPNFSTRFNKKRIQLTFNEWVTLSDVQTQVVVSPPLVTKRVPDVRLKGKTVIVEIPEAEVLRPNTTYTINFGTSVKDLHEGNIAKDLRFVFSTGDYIDSLSVRGTVLDAFSGEPVDNISLMLYDNPEDSVVRLEKPYYFARTGKDGAFLIQNVRAGDFKIVAIEDADQNLKWSGENERIGFADSLLMVNDSVRNVLKIRLFNDYSRLKLLDKNAGRYGLIKLTYNGVPDTVKLASEVEDLRLYTEQNLDTLLIWYELPVSATWQLRAGKDTISVRNLSREDFLKSHKLGFPGEVVLSGKDAKGRKPAAPVAPPGTDPKSLIPTISQNVAKPALFTFNFPISEVDTAEWIIMVDSTRFHEFTVTIDSFKRRTVALNIAWQQNKIYKLMLLPGALTDFYGVINSDTLQRNINVLSEKLLGGLNLTVKDLRPGEHYILQLLAGDRLEEERIFDATSAEKRFIFSKLSATSYNARIIEDRNRNNRWDTGSYFSHLQPELLTTKKLDPLRSNWEVEATLEMGTALPKKK